MIAWLRQRLGLGEGWPPPPAHRFAPTEAERHYEQVRQEAERGIERTDRETERGRQRFISWQDLYDPGAPS